MLICTWPSDKSQVFMVSVGSTLVGESMKPSTVRIGSVVSENTRHKDSFIYIVDIKITVRPIKMGPTGI